jgi:hypothetical protein
LGDDGSTLTDGLIDDLDYVSDLASEHLSV